MSRPRLVLWALLAAAASALVIERLIVTDQEAIESVLEDAAQDVVRGDDAAMTRRIVEDYDERGKDRAALVKWAHDIWQRSQMRSLHVEVVETKVSGDRAAARIVVRPGPSFAGAPMGGLRLGGRIDLRRTHEGWRIEGVAPDDPSILAR